MTDAATETRHEVVVGEIADPPPARALRPMPDTSPSHLLALAVQQGADLDRLEKLMALKERHEANEARKAFVAAMAAFKAEPIDIRKSKAVGYNTKEGDFVGYKHATTADVVDAVVPAMGKHGLSHRWDVQQAGGQITVICEITHELGHRESVSMTAAPDNSGKKNPIQMVASTVQYLQRYTLMAATGVAAKDQDDDGRAFDGGDAGDAQDNGPDPLQIWFDAIEAAGDITELKRVKAEMIKAVGNEHGAVPKPLLDSYNARVKALK